VTRHLVFTLYAPFGSWGAASLSAANQAYRATELSPPRSALTGLIGAALGQRRQELAELAQMLLFDVREGLSPVRDLTPDYHTTTALRLLYDPDYPGAPEPQRVRIRRDDPAGSGDPTGRFVRLFFERREAEALISSRRGELSPGNC